MADNCLTNLTLMTTGNGTQTLNGNGGYIKCFDFVSSKTAGGLSLASPAGTTKLRVGRDFRLDYTNTAVFADQGDTVMVGDDAEIGSATATASNYTFTGLLDFTGEGYDTDLHLSDFAGTGAPVATFNSLRNRAGQNSTDGRLELYPVAAGATLKLKADLSLVSGSGPSPLHTNGNAIEIGGNWSLHNASAFEYGTGSMVTFNGTIPQAITSPDGLAFHDFVWSNTNQGVLTSNVSVSHNLTVANGTIQTGASKIVLGPTATITETDASYVLGTVEATRPVSQNVTENFGNIGFGVTAAADAPGITTVTRKTGPTATQTGYLGHNGISRYFDVSAVVDTGLDATVVLSYFEHELNGIDESMLAPFRSKDAGLTWVQLMDRLIEVTPNRVTANHVAGFSRWTLGSQETPLPVTLKYFRGNVEGGDGHLTWETASEKDNAGFYVEKSLDGKRFTSLGFVPAKQKPSLYGFVDQAMKASAYYRLRMVDMDGKQAYSQTILLKTQGDDFTLNIYPNPYTRNAKLDLGSYAGEVSLSITSLEGKPLLQNTASADQISARFYQATQTLQPGTFLVHARGLGFEKWLRLMRQ